MDWKTFPWLPFWLLGAGLVLGILARLDLLRHRTTEERRRETRGTPTAPLPTA